MISKPKEVTKNEVIVIVEVREAFNPRILERARRVKGQDMVNDLRNRRK